MEDAYPSYSAPEALAPYRDRPVGVRLTPRQLEVLVLLCEGLPNKVISQRLGISVGTVKVHIGCMLREMRVSSRLQAVVEARRSGLVSEAAQDSPAFTAAFALGGAANGVLSRRRGRPTR